MLAKAAIEIVLFDNTNSSASSLLEQIKLLSEFYGIHYTLLSATENPAQQFNSHLQATHNRVVAVIINAEVLADLDTQQIQSLLLKHTPATPVLIIGVRFTTCMKSLQAWSGHVVSSVQDIDNFSGQYFFHQHPITQQLGNQTAVWKHPQVSSLQLNNLAHADIIIELIPLSDTSADYSPQKKHYNWDAQTHLKQALLKQKIQQVSLLKTEHQDLSIFISAYVEPTPLHAGELIWRFKPRRFMQIAALMLVIQQACGEYAWHIAKRFANFTIDDPWLTEPYGQLNYTAFLKEMQTAKFHTTIAFIPWNYDRSEPEAIDIFKNNPDHYSLCVHGNNHDHREFYKYKTDKDDPWSAKALETHDVNLQQGLARLEKFRELTGLNYDQVMVFPHNIAPEETLRFMKKYNFLATSNGGNIPLESPAPDNPLFYFRTVSNHFANFPSLDRLEPVEYFPMKIALNLYLGSPILFFEHMLYFTDGLDVFNETAQRVNQIQPDIQWTSLGEIARHLYEQRKIDDNNYEIKALSRQFKLYNTQSNKVHFTVFKSFSADEEIASISSHGNVLGYTKEGDYLKFLVTIPAQQQRLIDIQYVNKLNLSQIDVNKTDAKINRLRWFSDFRDITFSGSYLGGLLTKWYYNSGHYQGGLKRILFLASFAVIGLGLMLWLFIHQRLHPKSQPKTAY